jgi:hypothetical protein
LKKIFLTRLEYWAERYEILSPTLYGFRKRRETIDCVVLLSTAIQSSFERKQQTLVDFLDISGDYDNVLIDIHTKPPIYVYLNGRFVPVVLNFSYLGVAFDGKLLWGHSCTTFSRNVSRELTFFDPWRGYHRGHIWM